MRAIAVRQQLLLGKARWSQLDESQFLELKGGVSRGDSGWWRLLGRMARGHEKAVRDHEVTIRPVLDRVGSAEDAEFLEVAVEAMQELTSIDSVAHGTATLLLALARPDRLLSLDSASQKAHGRPSGMSPSTPSEHLETLAHAFPQARCTSRETTPRVSRLNSTASRWIGRSRWR